MARKVEEELELRSNRGPGLLCRSRGHFGFGVPGLGVQGWGPRVWGVGLLRG